MILKPLWEKSNWGPKQKKEASWCFTRKTGTPEMEN
jgi:hypothetical protein